jgi:isochorismate synthase
VKHFTGDVRFMWSSPTQSFELARGQHLVSTQFDRARSLLRRRPQHVFGALVPFDTSEPAHIWVGEPKPLTALAPVEARRRPAARRLSTSTPDAVYRDAVRSAVASIRSGVLDKVVLCRHIDLECDQPWDPRAVLGELAEVPSSVAFGVGTGNGATTVGASPEVLVSLRDGRLRSSPLAGSVRRPDDETARRLARRALLASAKNTAEHAFVVRHLEERMTALAGPVHVQQSVLETSDSMHLVSDMVAHPTGPMDSLDYALALHPTPAICGTPTAAAMGQIQQLEDRPRGPFTGLVGWQAADGSGEWRLVIRSAVLSGGSATVSAGAGVVAASDPDDELDETRHKMLPMLRAMHALDQEPCRQKATLP